MPRPKPLAEPGSKPVKLHKDGTEALVSCLCLLDEKARKRMVTEVETLLTNHRLFTARNSESAASKRDTLKPMLKHALALQKGIQALPPALRMELCGASSEPAISDDELERLCRVLACAVRRNAESADSAKTGRPAGEETLRQTVWGLQHIFETYYRGPHTEDERKVDTFIHLALNAAGVLHPEPNSASNGNRNGRRFTKLKLPGQSVI